MLHNRHSLDKVLFASVLRKRGYLYSEIANELKVSKSTAYVWTKNIKLSVKQASQINDRLMEKKLASIKAMALAKKLRRSQKMEQIYNMAGKIVKEVHNTKANKQLSLSLLFWGEGSKDVKNGVRFMNSDPLMIRAFIELMKDSFNIDSKKFRCLIHLHEYHNQEAQLKFWSNITGIPAAQFYKPYIKPHTGINKRENYPGCISVRYADVSMATLLKMIYTEFAKLVQAT